MSISGITMHNECLTVFNDLKTARKYKYVFFTIGRKDDAKSDQVIVASTHQAEGTETETWQKFVDSLPPNEPIIGIYDIHFRSHEGHKKEQPLMVAWCPGTAHIKKKMVQTTSVEMVKKSFKLGDDKMYFQADELGDIELSSVLAKIGGKELES